MSGNERQSATDPVSDVAGKYTRYTQKAHKTILLALDVGGTVVEACAAAGINRTTYYRWLKDIPKFAEAVELVETTRALKWLTRIENAVQAGDWHAAAWKLEHMYPERFGKQRVELSAKDGDDIAIAVIRTQLAEKLDRWVVERRAGAVASGTQPD